MLSKQNYNNVGECSQKDIDDEKDLKQLDIVMRWHLPFETARQG